MLDEEQIENWEGVQPPHNVKVIEDLYSMYLFSGEFIPYKQMIMMLQHESGSKSRLYDIATHIQAIEAGEI